VAITDKPLFGCKTESPEIEVAFFFLVDALTEGFLAEPFEDAA